MPRPALTLTAAVPLARRLVRLSARLARLGARMGAQMSARSTARLERPDEHTAWLREAIDLADLERRLSRIERGRPGRFEPLPP